jgi:hypothetical protein
VLAGDDADTLASRVLAAEHRLYPQALALVAGEAVMVENERVFVRGRPISLGDVGRIASEVVDLGVDLLSPKP